MEGKKERPVSGDEIDIAQFFRWVGKGFSNAGDSLIGGMATLRNMFHDNRIFFVGIMVFGLILGFMYSELVKKEYYKSSMVLRCEYLTPEILRNTITKFNLLAGEANKEGLQSVLQIDEATARNIQRFEFKSLVEEGEVVEMEILKGQLNTVTTPEKEALVERIVERLEIENRSAYEIGVYVYDPGIVKPLEKALVDYFNNNSYIQRRIVTTQKLLEGRKAKLEAELLKLDSLKIALILNYKSLAERGRGSNNVVVGGEESLSKPVDIFTAGLKIHTELQEVQRKLDLRPDFEIVDGFTSFQKPQNASLMDILAVALLISVAVGYLILGAYRFDRMLANYPRNRSAARS